MPTTRVGMGTAVGSPKAPARAVGSGPPLKDVSATVGRTGAPDAGVWVGPAPATATAVVARAGTVDWAAGVAGTGVPAVDAGLDGALHEIVAMARITGMACHCHHRIATGNLPRRTGRAGRRYGAT